MWPFLYSIGVAFYLVGNYPEWREGVFFLAHDISSMLQWLLSRGPTGRPAKSTSKTAIRHDSTSIWVSTGSSEIKSRTKALFSDGFVIAEPYKTYHGSEIQLHSREMATMVAATNDPYTVMVDSSPLGFARVVRDFIAFKTREYSTDANEHCFFVFHPDNAWMGAFMRLEHIDGPLPPEFVGVAHDLFVLCRWMLCVRVALVQAMGDAGKRIYFHILIPTCEPLVIPRPFNFIDALFPLVIEGPVRRGHELVWLRVVPPSIGLLRDVGSIPSPSPARAERKACLAICIMWITASPLLVVVCKYFCVPNIPFYVALSITTVFHGCALAATLWVKREVKGYYLQEESPATLG